MTLDSTFKYVNDSTGYPWIHPLKFVQWLDSIRLKIWTKWLDSNQKWLGLVTSLSDGKTKTKDRESGGTIQRFPQMLRQNGKGESGNKHPNQQDRTQNKNSHHANSKQGVWHEHCSAGWWYSSISIESVSLYFGKFFLQVMITHQWLVCAILWIHIWVWKSSDV